MKNHFEKVIGYEQVKNKLEVVIDIINNEEKYKKLGASVPRNIIIKGVPGIGKTLIAKSFMEACNRKSYILRKDKPDDQFVNEISRVFEEAVKCAPSIVLIDDLDKFSNEDDMKNNTQEYIAVQSCIDNVKDKNVFVIATANHLDKLPNSLLRKGRFDIDISLTYPNSDESKKIIKYYLQDKPLDKDVDIDIISKILDGTTCANIESILNRAAMLSAYNNKEKIGQDEIIKTFLNINESEDDYSDKMSDSVKLKSAYHEAGHVLVGHLLCENSFTVAHIKKKIIIVDFGGRTYFTASFRPENSFHDMELTIMRCLAGKAALDLKFSEPDIGCRTDLRRAIELASDMESLFCCYGIDKYNDGVLGLAPGATQERVNLIVTQLYQKTKKFLNDNIELLDKVAEKLYNEPYVLYTDVDKLKEECKGKVK